MINVITINLLAEKAYRKYCKVALLDFSKRSERFYLQITKLMPDVMLLQEVDLFWREYLESNIVKLGYSIQFGECWSSGLAILWRNDLMKSSNKDPLNFSNAGVLSIELVISESNEVMHFINLHAPWGRAEKFENFYLSAVEGNAQVIIAGDLNTDDPEKNNNFNYFFSKLFKSEKGYKELTEFIQFTARNVKTNNAEKLDYIVGLNIFGNNTKIYPEILSLILPHSAGGEFFSDNENNHFSDHALVFSNITLKNRN